ncbi:hypothetical protein HanRHA438_Chr08g0346941 [Helianthus annuus]|nr:hypothetical protein HanRHA438_Chr08g0346941 [Helianthus annuus]
MLPNKHDQQQQRKRKNLLDPPRNLLHIIPLLRRRITPTPTPIHITRISHFPLPCTTISPIHRHRLTAPFLPNYPNRNLPTIPIPTTTYTCT